MAAMTLRPAEESLSIARTIVSAAADKKAEDILLLDLRELSSVADYFVVCSGSNERQLRAIAESVEEKVHERYRQKPHHIEGASGGGWVLVDYGDVVVHIFAPSTRTFYKLESLWNKAPVLLRMQ
jgi:ribosome-associated protein